VSDKQDSTATQHFTNLIQFRQAAYPLLGNAHDALFELCDANLEMKNIHCLAELSLASAFRRQWSSVYEALQDGRPDRLALLRLYLSQRPAQEQLILASDHTAWSRLWAGTLPGRSYQHQPTPIPGRRPVTIGHGYGTLAIIPEQTGSWALPLLHEQITDQKPVLLATRQLRQVYELLQQRFLCLLDSEYGCATFLSATADLPIDRLFRLRTNLCLEGPTKPRKPKGAPPKHGIPFKFKDPTTWWEPDQIIEEEDPHFGPLVIRIWEGLRFKQALDCRMIVAQIERVRSLGTRRKPKIIWLGWFGAEPPAHWWSLYARRYPIDHWYRFVKSRLHWTLPLLSSSSQCQCWSDLMPLMSWELWLARPIAEDCHLPWQKAQTQLTPGRVCQAWEGILARIGTPTQVCKSRGKSPGWPKGQERKRREEFPLVRSAQWERIRSRRNAVPPGQKAKRGRPKKISDTNLALD
jgi:hypothetical protein